MIKPVTFQGQFNFNANLYALEVRSRFIDQEHADGYYTDYGDELAAQIVGNTIQVGTGAFVVQGRMLEVTATETVQPQIFDGFKGYILARIETYHPADDNNGTLLAKIQTSWEALDSELEQNDVYANTADNINTAYELPIYSFEISGTSIVNLTKLIQPVCDYATIKAIVDNAYSVAAAALAAANTAVETATAAKETAEGAAEKSDAAVATSKQAAEEAANALSVANALDAKIDEANTTAAGAVTVAEGAVKTAQEAVATAEKAANVADAATEKVEELAEQIGEKQGTSVTLNGVAQATFEAGGLINEGDTIVFRGGGA